MAQNTLMFEVGVESTVKGLNELKQQLANEAASLQEKLNLKVKLTGLDEVSKQLSAIGDSQALRNVRQEIEALNKEFAKLAAGAGGTGTMAIRSLSQSIVEQEQEIKKYERILEQLRNTRKTLTEGTMRYKQNSEAIAVNETSLASAQKSLEKFKEQLNNIDTASMKGVGDSAKMAEQAFSAMKPMIEGVNGAVKTLAENMTTLVNKIDKMNTAPAPKIAEGMQQAVQTTKAESEEVQNLQSKLEQIQEKIARAKKYLEEANKGIRDYESKYGSYENAQSRREASIASAQQKDSKLKEKAITELDKKWNSYWEKQERQAQRFAEVLKKELGQVSFSDFKKHIGGQYDELAKSWYRVNARNDNDLSIAFGARGELTKARKEAAAAAMSEDKKIADTAKAEMGILDALKRKYNEYFNARRDAERTTPNTNALAQSYKVEDAAHLENLGKKVGAEKVLNSLLAEESAAQQKLNELKAQGTTATEKATQAAQQLANVESKPTQGGLFDPQKFATLQEAIDKIVKEVNRLASAFNGIKTDGIESLARVINGLQINANNVSSAFQNLEGKMKFQGTAEEFTAYEKRIQELKTEIANLEAQAKNTAENVKKMNTEFQSIGEKKGSESARTDNLDKLRAHAEVVGKALERMEAEFAKLGQNGLFDQRLKEQIEQLRSYAQHLKDIESSPLINKPNGLKAGEVAWDGKKLMGNLVKDMYSEKTIKAFTKDVNDILQAKAVQDLQRQQIQLKAPRPDDKDAIGEIIEKNKARLQEWRQQFAEAMQYMRQQMKRTSAGGGDTTMLQNAYRSYYQMAVQLGRSVNEETLKDTKAVDELTKQYHALRNEILATGNIAKNNSIGREGINEANIREATVAYAKLRDHIDGLVMSRDKLAAAGQNTSALDAEIAKGKEFMRILERISEKGYYGNLRTWDVVKSADFRTIAPNAHDAVREMRENQKVAEESARQQEKAFERQAKSINDAGKAISDLQKKYERFRNNDTFKKAFDLGIDTSAYSQAIERLLRYQRILQYIRENGGHDASRITGSAGYRDMQNNLDIQLGRLKQQVKEKERIGKITSQLAIEENRFSTAINQTTSALRGQSQIMSDLKMMATQYIGVWGAQQFIHNVIEIGGQLEKQRLSLGAILGDVSQANELFDNIKNLAIKSPFGVVELDQFTKQLSAYGFKYNELFDMTKRLADISAGAGTDVSRLALALGHVRAEGALSGYTLRQFAMNNIPMVSKLAERLTELEGRIVSVAEVRKRVSKKEIGYSDVEAVIKDLTDEGGMFYNMQETISQSVASKFKNLKDAMDIMYGEMAEGGIGDVLKLIATGLTNLTREWKVLLPVIVAGTSYFGLHKLALLGVNAQITQYGVSSKFLSGETYKLTAEQVKNLAVTGQITQRQLLIAVATRRLTVEQAEAAAATYGLTKAQLQQIAVSGRLDKAMLANSISTSKYTSAQLRAMTAARVSGFGPLNGLLTKLKLGWMGATAGATKFFTAMKAMGASVGWLVALEAVITLITHQFQKLEEEKERKASLLNKATEGFKNTNESSMRFKVGASVELNTTELKTQIDALKQELKEYSPQAGTVLKEAFKTDATGRNIHTLAQQYELLSKELKATRDGYQELESVSSLFETANDATGGRWYQFGLNDDIRENVEDYIGALKDQKDAEADLLRNRGKMEESVERLRKNYSQVNDIINKNVELYKTSGGKQGYAESDTMAKFRTIYEQGVAAQNTELKGLSQDDIKSVNVFKAAYSDLIWTMSHSGEELKDNWVDYQDAILTTKNKFEDFTDDAQKYTSDLVRRLEGQFNTTVDKFSTSQKRAVQLGLEAFLNGIDGFKDLTKEERDTIEKELLKPFKIEVDVELSEAYKNLDEFQQYLRSITSKNWTVNINTVTSTKDLIKSGQDSRKNMKEMDKTSDEPFKKAGISKDRIKEYARKYYEEGKQQAQEVEETVAELSTPWNPGGVSKRMEKKKSDAKKEFENYIGDVQSDIVKNNAREYFDAYIQELGFKEIEGEGYDFSDDKKTKSGRGEDKNAKAVRERVRVIKEAADAYEYWRNKVGDDAAWAHVEEEFGSVLKTIKVNAKNVGDLKGNLDNVLKSGKFAAIRDKKVKTEIEKEVSKDKAQIDRKDWEKESAENLSEMNKQLEDLTRRWEIFNTVREHTGDVGLAQQLAGLTPAEMNMRNSADAMKGMLSASYGNINFEEVYNLDDKGIDNYVKKIGVPQKKIAAVVDALKKWRDLQRDIFRDDLLNLSKVLGSTEDYGSQVKKINDELEKTKESIEASSGTREDKNKAISLAETRAQWEKEQLSADFSNLFNNTMALSQKAFNTEVTRIEGILDSLFAKGGISPEKMTEWKNKISEARTNFTTAGFLGIKGSTGAFLGGGYRGMVDYHKARRDAALERRNRAEKDSEEYKDADTEYKKENDLVKSEQSVIDAMDKISKAANMAADGMSLLGNLFDALGMEGASNVMSDAGGILGGAMSGASSLSALGPYGMAAGAALGGLTSIAQLHDKSIQREIDAIQDQVDALEDNTEAIRSARERTLGYDTGDLRRSFAAQYNSLAYTDPLILSVIKMIPGFPDYMKNGFTSAGEAAMGKYYGKNTEGTGYSQELANLKSEREKYLEMYNLENEKKKSSQDALDEYTKKIAELDDQIRFFVEDLANELWSIDIKGWADQISDALWTAFENGEDAVGAFGDVAKDIVSSVAQEMMKLGIIEPMMQAMRDELFSNEYTDSNGNRWNGVYNTTQGTFDEEKTLQILGKYLGEGGVMQNAAKASEMFYEWAEKVSGMDFGEGSSTSSKVIQGGFTEDETGLVLSYMNAMRADLSINRQMIGDYFPQFLQAMTYGNQSLWNIESHTAAIMRSNDAISQRIASLDDNIKGLKNKTWKMPVS